MFGSGLLLVNEVEIAKLRNDASADVGRYAFGALLAVGGVACWTWYPIRNADWSRAHPGRSPRTCATAQGVATLPLALLGYPGCWLGNASGAQRFAMPFGPLPHR